MENQTQAEAQTQQLVISFVNKAHTYLNDWKKGLARASSVTQTSLSKHIHFSAEPFRSDYQVLAAHNGDHHIEIENIHFFIQPNPTKQGQLRVSVVEESNGASMKTGLSKLFSRSLTTRGYVSIEPSMLNPRLSEAMDKIMTKEDWGVVAQYIASDQFRPASMHAAKPVDTNNEIDVAP